MFQHDLESIGKRIEKKRKDNGWTQEMLAEKLNMARNTLTKLEGGFRDFKSSEISNIAKTLDVSTDYLLGLTPVSSIEVTTRDTSERYGLTEAALNTLSDMPESEKPYGGEHIATMRSRATTMACRKTVSLLLSTEQGKEALCKLATFFFGEEADKSLERLTTYILPWEVDIGATYLQTTTLSEELQRRVILDSVMDYIKELRGVLVNPNSVPMLAPQIYSYTNPSKTEEMKEMQAAYDELNPHKNNDA